MSSTTHLDDETENNANSNIHHNRNRLAIVSLPREWQDYDLKKDEANAIFDLQRFRSVLEPDNNENGGSNNSNSDNFGSIVDAKDLCPEDMIVALDLELFRKEETIKIRLNRDAKEIANKAFQRLELSVAKKLSPGRKTKKKKKSKKQKQKPTEASQAGNEDGKIEPSLRLMVRANFQTTTLNRDGTTNTSTNTSTDDSSSYEINTETFDTIGLCRELASLSKSSSVELDVSMPVEQKNRNDNTCTETNNETETTTLGSTNFRFGVDSNLPVILATQTFESFRSKLFVGIPVVVQTTLLHTTSVEVSWFLSSSGTNDDDDNETEELLVLRNSHSFVPEANHIGKSLSVVLRPVRGGEGQNNPRLYGAPEAYKFCNTIEALPIMPIVSPLRDDFIQEKSEPDRKEDDASETPPPLPLHRLRVCTYNILADLYVSRKGTTDGATTYPHVLYEHVEKSRRIPMIVAELLAYRADIICLQEVDGSVYDAYLQPVLKTSGYDGYYSNKASTQREGCAIFWSTTVLEVDQARSFDVKELFEPSRDGIFERKWGSMKGIRELMKSHKELHKVATKKLGQIVQIARLIPKHPRQGQPKALVVANTHLFWHPMADHVRAMQAYAVAKKIDEVRRNRDFGRDNSAVDSSVDPFLLCGDLNSDPLSGACQLLTTKTLKPDHHDCWKYLHEYQWDVDDNDVETMVESGTTAEERRRSSHPTEATKYQSATTPPSIELPGSFPDMVSGCQPNPSFTNFSLKFAETLDYVLASRPSEKNEFGFRPRGSAPMPSIQDVTKFVSMPNELMPSDHVSIVCDLEWSRWDGHSPE